MVDALRMAVEVIVLVAALWYAPAMLWDMHAHRQRVLGRDYPLSRDIKREMWRRLAPILAALGWLVAKALAPRRVTSPPPWVVSSISADDYVEPQHAAPQKTATDLSLSAGLSALPAPRREAIAALILDTPDKAQRREVTNRATLVGALVAAGWQVGEVRAVVKGDSEAIGIECQAAQARFGVREPRRVVTIHGGRSGEVEL